MTKPWQTLRFFFGGIWVKEQISTLGLGLVSSLWIHPAMMPHSILFQVKVKFRTCCACTCKDYVCIHSQPKWLCHFGSSSILCQEKLVKNLLLASAFFRDRYGGIIVRCGYHYPWADWGRSAPCLDSWDGILGFVPTRGSGDEGGWRLYHWLWLPGLGNGFWHGGGHWECCNGLLAGETCPLGWTEDGPSVFTAINGGDDGQPQVGYSCHWRWGPLKGCWWDFCCGGCLRRCPLPARGWGVDVEAWWFGCADGTGQGDRCNCLKSSCMGYIWKFHQGSDLFSSRRAFQDGAYHPWGQAVGGQDGQGGGDWPFCEVLWPARHSSGGFLPGHHCLCGHQGPETTRRGHEATLCWGKCSSWSWKCRSPWTPQGHSKGHSSVPAMLHRLASPMGYQGG